MYPLYPEMWAESPSRQFGKKGDHAPASGSGEGTGRPTPHRVALHLGGRLSGLHALPVGFMWGGCYGKESFLTFIGVQGNLFQARVPGAPELVGFPLWKASFLSPPRHVFLV